MLIEAASTVQTLAHKTDTRYKRKDKLQAEHAYSEVLNQDLFKQIVAEHSAARGTKHMHVY